jgi:uncharacterized protein (TIRG00374 family)
MMSPATNFGHKEKLSGALKWVGLALLIFLGLILLAGQVVGLQGLHQAMARLGPATVVLLVLATVANTGIRFLCWPYFCRVQEIFIPLNRLALYYTAGMALLPTPGKLGTALRLWLMKKYHQVPYRRSAPILLLDLLTDFLALIILVALALPWLGQGTASSAGARLGVFMLAAALAGILSVLYYPPLPRLVIKLAYKAGGQRARKLFANLLRLTVALRVLVGPRNLAITVGLSLAGWTVTTLAFGFLLHDLGYGYSWPLATFAIGCGIILGALAMLPGGLGSTEAIVMAILLANHVGLAEATIFTALMRVCTLWLPVAVGLGILPFALRRHSG